MNALWQYFTRLRIHSRAYDRDVVFVYGWRDVVAWPMTVLEWSERRQP